MLFPLFQMRSGLRATQIETVPWNAKMGITLLETTQSFVKRMDTGHPRVDVKVTQVSYHYIIFKQIFFSK